jgi:CubicO group peptidase (beta-lactamase class C family)
MRLPLRRTGLALVLLAAPAEGQQRWLDAPLAARVDSVYSRFATPGSPGCAVGIAWNGRQYARGYGLASVEHAVPITPATVFDIGSASKQFTAMSVVLLAQDGKLSLDDEIQRFLPEVPRYSAPVTIRHLLHHTSGIRDYIDVLSLSGFGDEAVTTEADALDAIVRQKVTNFTPGSEQRYSNSGYFLLSVIVKRASGQSLRDFAAKRIFGPLQMTGTQFVDRHELIVPGKAGSYAPGPQGSLVLALANWEQTGDGAVNTTVQDLFKWDRNFETGAVGGAAGLAEMHKVGVLTGGKPITYALGLVVDKFRGVRQVAHGGAWAGFRAHLARFPEEKLSLISLCNIANSNPGQLNQRVAGVLLEGKLEPAAEPGAFVPSPLARSFSPTAATLAGIAGTYRTVELLADLIISVRGDTVLARPGLSPEQRIRPVAADTFAFFGTRMVFVRTGGAVTGLLLYNRGLLDFQLTKVTP